MNLAGFFSWYSCRAVAASPGVSKSGCQSSTIKIESATIEPESFASGLLTPKVA